MKCEFKPCGENYYCCPVCGLRIHSKDPSGIVTECPGPPTQKPPGILKKVTHYAQAVTKHITTGMETRTDEEVIQLLQLCELCEKYADGRCNVCGCRISAAKNAFINKLRMKSEHCPLEKW